MTRCAMLRMYGPVSLLSASLVVGCAHAGDELSTDRSPSAAGRDSGSGGGTPGSGGSGGTAAGTGAAATAVGGSAGTGLTSDVFGDGGVGDAGDTTDACEYGDSPSCDWSRIEGCCNRWACEHANGADVFNTYPIESCQALVACVQANAGCTNAADPLCFQNEDPNAPCLMEGYQASHEDPEGPFGWTADLVDCVCGY